MSTTTIRIDEDLKARIAAAAKRAGTTPHSFMVDAISETVEQFELNGDFHRVADERWMKILATGKTVSWDEARKYLRSRASGKTQRKPLARKMAR